MRKANKTIRKQLGDKSMVDMFNQMLGTGSVDPKIVLPKYNKIKSSVCAIIKLLNSSVCDVFSKFDQKSNCDEINDFIKELESIEFKTVFDDTNSEEDLGTSYTSLKNNNTIKKLVLTCKNLIPYKDKLSILENEFDDSFIARIPGFVFCPFPFSGFNIKTLWVSDNVNDRVKKYTFTVLKLVLDNCKSIYDILTSPDVNVKDFSKVIITSITEIKKRIPRCEKAFAKIEQSVGMLENNFNGYYKDFIQSQNPNTIIESFVLDVSSEGGTDIQTTRQFRKIIEYYRKATQGKIQDPRVKKIFEMLNSNFNAMEDEIKK
jgi:hypothetical protein